LPSLRATVSIIDVALTLLIPLLHRISKADDSHTVMATPLEERNAAAIDKKIALRKKEIASLEKLKSRCMQSAVGKF
jgi:hypothetical protein